MAAGDSFFDCAQNKSLEVALREMIVQDGNGKPIFKQIDPINSSVSQTSILGAVSNAANITALQTWKDGNPTKRIVRITPVAVSATITGFLVEYVA